MLCGRRANVSSDSDSEIEDEPDIVNDKFQDCNATISRPTSNTANTSSSSISDIKTL